MNTTDIGIGTIGAIGIICLEAWDAWIAARFTPEASAAWSRYRSAQREYDEVTSEPAPPADPSGNWGQNRSEGRKTVSSFLADFEYVTAKYQHLSAGGFLRDCPICGVWVESCDGSCASDDPDICYCDETFLSSRPCDTCGTKLAGNRRIAHAIGHTVNPDETLTHLDCCMDCAAWLANGDLPEDWSAS